MSANLNYQHLYYFWMIAREGSIAGAARALHLTPQTVSGQLAVFESSLGGPLFHRRGKRLVINELGAVVQRYADEIFALGRELKDVVRGVGVHDPVEFVVGVADVIPKTIACRLLSPALAFSDDIRIVCYEHSLEQLLAELNIHRIDLVLSDQPLPPVLKINGFSHHLGNSATSFLCTSALAKTLSGRFPDNLHNAPMLLQTPQYSLRKSLDQWFEQQGIVPKIRGEFDDSALLKTFAQAGFGVFALPTVAEREICSQRQLMALGRTSTIEADFFAIVGERRVKHPAVMVVIEMARQVLSDQVMLGE